MEKIIQIDPTLFSELQSNQPYSATCLQNPIILTVLKLEDKSTLNKNYFIFKSHVACPQLDENKNCQILKRRCGLLFKSDSFYQK